MVSTDKREFLEKLQNKNSVLPIDVKRKYEDGIIAIRDLEDIGIPEDIIPHIFRYIEPTLESKQDTNPEKIKESCLEVYFWGLRSSGKTCAISGILRTIFKDGKYQRDPKCYNKQYLNSLKDNIIDDDNIAYFPDRTIEDRIRYMNFYLITEKTIEVHNWSWKKFGFTTSKKRINEKRKVAFIDLAGELITNIVDNDDKKEKDNVTITTLKSLLRSDNRKLHFFFIDYDNINRKLNQQSKLVDLIAIFKKEKYFDKTDFIYVVITKSDLFSHNGQPVNKNQRRSFANEFFNTKSKALKTNIIDICNSGKGINMNKRKEVILDDKILDFSMGDVYFKRLCRFNPDSAREIISILENKINTTDELYG